MKLVLFDCDGTLIDSAHVIHASMEKTFEEAGLTVPELHHTKSIIGLTLDKAFSKLLDREIDDHINHMVGRYKHHAFTMRETERVHEPFYDGIWELLEDLKRRDEVLLGVVTGKSRRGLDGLFRQHGLTDVIVTSRTADECPSKPHPAMVAECCRDVGVESARTVVVGDAIYDMQMARSAGATAVGVSWGYSTPDALVGAGADHVVHHPEEILSLLLA